MKRFIHAAHTIQHYRLSGDRPKYRLNNSRPAADAGDVGALRKRPAAAPHRRRAANAASSEVDCIHVRSSPVRPLSVRRRPLIFRPASRHHVQPCSTTVARRPPAGCAQARRRARSFPAFPSRCRAMTMRPWEITMHQFSEAGRRNRPAQVTIIFRRGCATRCRRS